MESSGAAMPAPPFPSAPSLPVPEYQDRSTGLIVFGILEIAAGALCALMIPLISLGLVVGKTASNPATALRSFAVAAFTYIAIAAVLIVLGIGAVQAKRWAWALNLILSWLWLIAGAAITAMLVVVLPQGILAGMRAAGAKNPGHPVSPGVMAVIVTVMIVFLALFLIFMPLAFLLFYRSRNVEETCKHHDPTERWTDRRPLPVLAVTLMAGAGAAYMCLIALTTPLFPFFGRYLTGIPAALVFFLLAVVDAYIAISFFRLKVAGWWVAVATLAIRVCSMLVTVGRANILQAYSHLGWSSEQIEHMRINPMLRSGVLQYWSVAFLVIYLAFLFWVKRYFRATAPPSYTEAADSVSAPMQPGS
ncbi:MAG TPA: hypothetical protein VFI95_16820 [Terriglobales bacterium]|nr:hypothetical protein [Terriglobales bacterium]